MAGPGLWAGPEASILEVMLRGDPMCLDAQSSTSAQLPGVGIGPAREGQVTPDSVVPPSSQDSGI